MRKSLLSAALMLGMATMVAVAAPAQRSFVPVTDATLESPDPADWLMVSRTYNEWRHSPLSQINKQNVSQLRMAWARSLPPGTQESTPLVYRGVMYLFAPGASIQAVDATNGDLIWEYTRRYPQNVRPQAAREKSIAIYQDMIYFAAPDGFLVAIDAQTGKQRWEAKLDNGGQQAGGILVADGKVISNRTCEQAKRENCFIAANDAKTGELKWKFFTTAAPGEKGGESWGNVPVNQRAAGPWGQVGSYDPKKKVLYWSVANPNPYTRLLRHGGAEGVPLEAPVDLFSNSTVALDVNTGQLNWYYQELPGDDWDADHNHERLLIHTKVAPDPKQVRWISSGLKSGEERDIVLTAAEGGGMFAVDQANGQFLWARPFPYDDPNINMNFIDVKTGLTRANNDKIFKKDGDHIIGCYHNTRAIMQTSYDPQNNSLYVPFHDQCLSMTANIENPTGYGPRSGVMRPGIDPNKYMNIGKVNVSTGEMKVIFSQAVGTNGSLLTTDGGLVFMSDLNRRVRALDAEDGKVLWENVVGGMVMMSTITYAVNGKQYVMVFTGEGQSVTGNVLALTKDVMPAAVHNASGIYVFALP
ncbi:MAG TPA: PQQ-binding-like beta-propeller repeat protein [Micropepsaceae bacterium]|nr:PQQ-binding-like beta-propeller repeat protein [Micropepsaceae bacterium]